MVTTYEIEVLPATEDGDVDRFVGRTLEEAKAAEAQALEEPDEL